MQAFLEKFSFENNKQINIDVWFPSNTYSILELSGVHKKIKMALRNLFQHYDSFVERGLRLGIEEGFTVFNNYYEI